MKQFALRSFVCISVTSFTATLLIAGTNSPRANSANVDRVALPAARFVDSIGVNTHLNYTDTAYGDFARLVKPSLTYLGVRHIRDGLADDDDTLARYRELHRNGIDLTGGVPYEVSSMGALISNINGQRDILAAVEGPNETDEFTQFAYKKQKFPDGTKAFMKDFYRAMKSDPALKTIPILQTTLAFPAQDGEDPSRAQRLGDLSAYADYGNSHNYFAFGEPPGDVIAKHHLPANTKITPGKPMMSSEGGYQMGDGDGYKGGWDDGLSAPFDENVHGRYLLRYVLEQFRLGYRRSFIYELLDIDQPKWGLFRANGTPRPAARGIRNLITLLGEGTFDPSSERWVMPRAPTASILKYGLSPLPESVHSVLLRKSIGTYYLILWNDANNWDAATAKPISVAPINATLTFGQSIKKIRTFKPLTTGIAPTEVANSTAVKLNVPDEPLVVEITP
jgi:hypothetical protein